MDRQFISYRRRMFTILVAAYVMEMYLRNCLNVSQGVLEAAFGMGAAAWGALGGAYSYSQLVCTLPSGILADYVDTKKLIAASLALVVVGSAVFAVAPSVPFLFWGRFLTGAGESFLFVAWIKSIGFWYGKKGQDFLTGFSSCLAYITGALALFPLNACLERFSWRAVYAVPVLATLMLLALSLRFTTTEPSGAGFVPPPDSDTAWRTEKTTLKEILSGLAELLKQKRTWPPLVMLLGIYGASYTLNGVWGASFVAKVYGISTTQTAGLLTFTLVGTAIAAFTAPIVSQAIRSRRIPLFVSCLGMTLCWSVLIFFAGRLSAAVLRMLFLLMGLCGSPTILGILLVKEMHPARYTGVSVSLFSLGAVFGGALVPLLVGVVYETLGDGADHYRLALCVCIVFLILSTICSLAVETHCISYERRAAGKERERNVEKAL